MSARRLDNEAGMTLVELMIAMAMSLVVFGLVATTLVAYQKDSQRTTRQNNSQDQARTAIDRIVRDVRNVASYRSTPTLIESAGAYDLVFQTVSPTAPAGGSQNVLGITRVRFCLPPDPAPGTATNQVLIQQTETWTSAAVPANPWPITGGVSTACPSTPSVPAGASIASSTLAEDVMNRYAGGARPAFSYDSSTLSQITTVGIDLFVDVDVNQAPAEIDLRSAAFLRNQNQAPVVSFTSTATGAGHLLLNGGGSSDPDNQQLTYKWFRVVGTTATQIGTSGLLDWTPGEGPGPYTVRLQVTDPGGLISTEDRAVVVS